MFFFACIFVELFLVTSSSSYSNSLEAKAGMLEVWRFPGIGFSLCAVPTFSHIQGISNGGYQSGFWNAPEWRTYTGTIPSMSTKMRETEVQSLYSSEVCGMCEIELVLLEESSRVRQIRVEFDIQNAETYMILGTYTKYSMKLSQGCTKNENKL